MILNEAFAYHTKESFYIILLVTFFLFQTLPIIVVNRVHSQTFQFSNFFPGDSFCDTFLTVPSCHTIRTTMALRINRVRLGNCNRTFIVKHHWYGSENSKIGNSRMNHVNRGYRQHLKNKIFKMNSLYL